MNTPESLKNIGNEYFKKGDFEAAIKYYKQAIEQNPQYIDAWNNLGFLYIKLGKVEEAKRCNSTVQSLKSQQNATSSSTLIETPPSPSDNTSSETLCDTTSEENGQIQSELSNEEIIIKKVENCKLVDFDEDGEIISRKRCYAILTNQRLAIFKSEDEKEFEVPFNSIEELSENDILGSLGIDITFTPSLGYTRNIELALIEGMFSKSRVTERDELFSLIGEYRKKTSPSEREGIDRGIELQVSGDMSVIGRTNDTPFPLQLHEELIVDAALVAYTGMKIENTGFFGGGVSDVGLGGGLFTGSQKKVEGGMFDAKRAHIYLTNYRFIVMVAKQNLSGTEEIAVESMICEIPIQSVVGINVKDSWVFKGFEISYRLSIGEVDKVKIEFFDQKKISRENERDYWIDLINEQIEKSHVQHKESTSNDDPIKILKLRYAKGEITKEEFLEMVNLLNS